MIELRDYQRAAVTDVFRSWQEYYSVLGVAPTGSGKTIVFADIADKRKELGPVLILAHRDELIDQAIDKLHKTRRLFAAKEKALDRASLDSDVIVASVQTLARQARLERFPSGHIQTVIVDEAHHSLANSYTRILDHFSSAKVLGVTATPDRGDKRNLADIFEDIAFEINLLDLIKAGHLCPIKINTIPVEIDISDVKTVAGDYAADELGTALRPWLEKIAGILAGEFADRKTLVFLPLIAISQEFAALCREHGLAAEHIDGVSPDRAEILSRFHRGETTLLSNAMLLNEGYDEPAIDCVICLRPTKIRSLYAQMVGRGTRTSPDKENLLLLDFLWLSREHTLVRPASLIARDERHQAEIEAQLRKANGDLLQAEADAQAEREAALARKLKARSQEEGSEVDLLELAARWQAPDIVDYQPTFGWEHKEITEKQGEILKRNGVALALVRGRGHASVILSSLFAFKEREPATEKQKWFCHYQGHPNPWCLTKPEASRWIAEHKQ